DHLSMFLPNIVGEIFLFWRGNNGFLWSSHKDDVWSEPEILWSEHKILRPKAVIDDEGNPVVLFGAIHSSVNTEIWALSRQDETWLPTQLTFSNSPDYSPDGIVLDDGSLLLVWINGTDGELSARWNILELNRIEENVSDLPRQCALKIYPSPFNSVLNIRWNGEKRNVKIRDISGRCVATMTGNGGVLWNAADMPDGIYFVDIGNGTIQKVFHIK
ncbi:T9SS type A sorting domain-containing protein, partial [bacterium]|nr:T9SS type A sorting domain-containing protein [bacterium]